MTGTLAQRIANIRSQLPTSVRLIAVTKQVPVEAMRTAYAAGLRDFGESRIQEAAAKQAQLQDLPRQAVLRVVVLLLHWVMVF